MLENLTTVRHPNILAAQALLVRELGEIEYNRRRAAEAAAWIRTHPPRFCDLTIRRFRNFWFPPDLDRRYRYPVWFVTAAGFAGLLRMARRRHPAVAPIAFVLLTYPLVYYLIQSDFRYRQPVYLFSALPAAYAAVSVLDGRSRRSAAHTAS